MAGRNDQHSEKQLGIEFLNFECSMGVRPGALAAIRIARRSYKTRSDAWPGGIDENCCIRDRPPRLSDDPPRQIGFGRAETVDCPEHGE